MNRIPSLVLIVLVLSLVAPTTAHDADPEIEFADGNVFLRHDHAHADHEGGSFASYACSDVTADTYALTGSDYCNTGQHSIAGAAVIGFGMHQPGLTGMLEHVISHDAGEVRFNCSWDAGTFTGCQIVKATWPAPGADFCHELWGHAGPPGLDWHVPNMPPCETTLGADGAVVTTNAPSGGSGKPVGPWTGYFEHQ